MSCTFCTAIRFINSICFLEGRLVKSKHSNLGLISVMRKPERCKFSWLWWSWKCLFMNLIESLTDLSNWLWWSNLRHVTIQFLKIRFKFIYFIICWKELHINRYVLLRVSIHIARVPIPNTYAIFIFNFLWTFRFHIRRNHLLILL